MIKRGNWNTLCDRLPYSFKDTALMFQAFNHPSLLVNNQDPTLLSYQRLEFIGDSVINLFAARAVYLAYPNALEGELTELRSMLVNNSRLAVVARRLELGSYLRILPTQEKELSRDDTRILACTFEALLGAIFIDSDGLYLGIKRIVEEHLLSDMQEVLSTGSRRKFDPKSILQEIAQAKFSITPEYRVLNTQGLTHALTFTVGVYLGEHCIGEGTGSSKKEAQKAAADSTLIQTNDLAINMPSALLKTSSDIFGDIEYEAR